ncbi:MAG: radical SAM protein [Clostridia bacterium]|nr:radical SAM protein [Clostridia bacterium]
MKISKAEALQWFEFFAMLDEEERLSPRQQELVLATLSQIEAAQEARLQALMDDIPGLKSLAGRTFYVGPDDRFPRGCRSCLLGTGLSAIRKTNRCNLNCPFCYDFGEMDDQPPIGEGFWEIGGTRFREEDLELLLSIDRHPTGIAYVYLEPFMEIEAYYGIVRRFREAKVYQHMYTNGTLATAENLRALGEAGLDELRFNLGATDCADRVIDMIGEAKRHIPMVGIETPMTPRLYETFLRKRDAILATGLDFVNCAELHLNPNNLDNYLGEPMYMYRQGYLSPTWSRELTLKLMKRASEEGWPCVVHDCADRTKFARDLNLRAREGGWFGASAWHSEFDGIPCAAFLPILRDEGFAFLEEEPLPEGYRPGDLVF